LVAQQQVLEHEVPAWARPAKDGRGHQPEQFKHTLSIADSAVRDLASHNAVTSVD
jgi:hypothetical protein